MFIHASETGEADAAVRFILDPVDFASGSVCALAICSFSILYQSRFSLGEAKTIVNFLTLH